MVLELLVEPARAGLHRTHAQEEMVDHASVLSFLCSLRNREPGGHRNSDRSCIEFDEMRAIFRARDSCIEKCFARTL